MIYDLSNPLEKEQFKVRANQLFKKEKIVVLIEKKEKRTIQQNKYLHLILSYFGLLTGNKMEYVKEEYFKKLCNRQLFEIEKEDKFLGVIKVLRSSADLNTSEMAIATERFRNWSSEEAGIYIPDPNEHQYLIEINREVEKNKIWL